MTQSFLKAAFTGGVLAPGFYGRSDMEKYELGLRQSFNWWVDYRGGISTRPPLEFVDFLPEFDKDIVIHPFSFNRRTGNNYLMIFGHQYVAFVQDGEYITEAAQTVSSITAGATTTVNATAHGYSDGDWVKLSDPLMPYSTVIVASSTANTFVAKNPAGNDIDTTGITFGTGTSAEKIYTVTTPYDSTDLHTLRISQYRDEVYITHVNYERRKLTRFADTNWTLTTISSAPSISAPVASSLAMHPAAGSAGVIYAITAVDASGAESVISNILLSETAINLTTTSGNIVVTWAAVSGALKYNVYRSLFCVTGTDITVAEQLGYIGESVATQFNDTNITPDFTKSPPLYDDPFADGAVIAINMTAGGSGYTKSGTTVSISGGTGFSGEAVVDSAGAIVGVVIINPGEGYDGGTVSFGGAGTGATATLETSPASGNNPACSTRAFQRRVYGGTSNLPMTIFASSTRGADDFNLNYLSTAADPYELSVDSVDLTPIRHLRAASLGMLAFTATSVYHIRGANDAVITADTAVAEERTSSGSSVVPPIQANDTFIYILAGSVGVKSIEPSSLRNYYETIDRSIFSNHYFSSGNKITSWAYAEAPHRVIWAAREDGTMLSFAFVPEQNVYAWSDHATDGYIKEVAAVIEYGDDIVYAVVERTVNGTTFKYLERMGSMTINNKEDGHAVDCFWERELTAGGAAITLSDTTGSVTVTAASGIFSSGDVGKVIRVGNGRGVITAYTDTTHVTLDLDIDVTDVNPITQASKSYSTWTIDSEITDITGLGHFEGLTVTVIGDGEEQTQQTVTDGAVTLSAAASHIVLGIDYHAIAGTLPLNTAGQVIEDKKKRITDASVRVENTRKLQAATTETETYFDFTDRYWAADSQAMFTGIREINVLGDWDENTGVLLKKAGPFKCKVLGFVINTEISLD